MNGKLMLQMSAIGIATAGASHYALSIESAPVTTPPPPGLWRSIAATESAVPPAAEPSAPDPKTKKPKPAVVESLTPEQATERAADPKAPSGALIIKPPIRKDPPVKDDPSSPPLK